MNFLYKKENALPQGLCNDFITLFEQSTEKRPGVLYGPEGISDSGDKKSTDLIFNPSHLNSSIWGTSLKEFLNILLYHAQVYIERHEIAFSKIDPIDLYTYFNMQCYKPGEGFIGWHCERASKNFLDRALVWMVYLNTVQDRGETEFYYQQHFESPVQGKLIIWPSDWTFLHRGIPSPTETKYILTGWFVHKDVEVISN